MKYILSLLIAISCIPGFAQDLTTKIPNDAFVVATIKGENLTQLMSIDEINNSYIGKELLKDLSRKKDEPYTSLSDLGINLEASSHYFFQANDSIHYNVFVLPIKNSAQFESFMISKNKNEIVEKNGFKTFENERNSDVAFIWNETALLAVLGDVSETYFEKADVMVRYGLQKMPDYSYDYGEYDDDAVYETPYEEEVIMEVGDDYEIVEETMIESTESSYDYDDVEETVVEATETTPLLSSPPPPAPPTTSNDYEIIEEAVEDAYVYDEPYDSAYDDSYNTAYNTNYDIKQRLQKEWTMAQAMKWMSQKSNQSIITNQSYLTSLDKDAEATVWVGDFAKIYDTMMSGLYYDELMGFNLGSMYANSGMSAKLFAEKDEIRLTTSYTMSESMADSYRKMMNQKINRKFFNYINEDQMIGYMSYALNTEAALKEYPKIMKNLYGSMPAYGDEAALAIDLVELLLDEEAVAKVLPGDMLFLLSGISEKELTYKSYEYNDDFEYEEIEKTKTETVPDFLLMISSEDQKLLKKLMDYGIKKEVVESKNGYYAVVIPESPLAAYIAFKDDIVFFGTSETEMNKIVRGTFDAKLSSKHKKLMKNSNFSAYVSGKQLASKIPMNELGEKEMKKLNWFLQNSEDAYISTSKMKGNVFEADMLIGVPASQENSLKYIFNMIETFAK